MGAACSANQTADVKPQMEVRNETTEEHLAANKDDSPPAINQLDNHKAEETREIENPGRRSQTGPTQPEQVDSLASPMFQPMIGAEGGKMQVSHVSVRRLKDSAQRKNLMEKAGHGTEENYE